MNSRKETTMAERMAQRKRKQQNKARQRRNKEETERIADQQMQQNQLLYLLHSDDIQPDS